MSVPKLTKKQKKGLAFRERKGKKQLGDAIEEGNAIPVGDISVEEDVVIPGPDIQTESIVKVREKKIREGKEDLAEDGMDAARNKRKRKVKETVGEDDTDAAKQKRRKLSEETEDKPSERVQTKARFILFVGNLKYTTSLGQIQEHFSTCDPPPQIRLLTPKQKSPGSTTTKSKGCAFLEFSHRNALQQGLKLHGSTLDGRRINVELTAGGGGKSDKRVEKVKARNKQLIEERKERVKKKTESIGEPGEQDLTLTAPPQRHSTTSGIDGVPQKRRTWSIPEDSEKGERKGGKQRGKKGNIRTRNWGTGANSIAVG